MATQLHYTHNKLDSNAKKVSMEILNARLVDHIDLALITKQAHWNIKGPNFIGVHEMLDKLRAAVDAYMTASVAAAEALMRGMAVATGHHLCTFQGWLKRIPMRNTTKSPSIVAVRRSR